MHIFKFLPLLIILILFISCSKKSNTYHPNGNLAMDCETKSGMLNGKCVGYYENGKIQSETYWVNGKQEGTWKIYYPNGTLKQTSSWKAGKENGPEINYHENGKIESEGNFVMGKLVGWFKEYDKEGRLETQYDYVYHSKAKNGKTVNQHIAYDKGGNIIPEESHYLVYSNVPDTLNIGKEYNLKIKLITPHYKSKMRLVKVCGEEGFIAGDPKKYEFIEAKNFEVT